MITHTIKQLISIANILPNWQQVNLSDIQLIHRRLRKMNPVWILISVTGHHMALLLHLGPTHCLLKLTNLTVILFLKLKFSLKFLRIVSSLVWSRVLSLNIWVTSTLVPPFCTCLYIIYLNAIMSVNKISQIHSGVSFNTFS